MRELLGLEPVANPNDADQQEDLASAHWPLAFSDWEAVEDSMAIMATKKILQQEMERHNSSSRRQIKEVTTEVPHLSGGLDFRMNFT